MKSKFQFTNKEILAGGHTLLPGDKKFVGNACAKCGGTERYANQAHTCVACAIKRSRLARPVNGNSDTRHAGRLYMAKRDGFAPAPHENNCGPYPEDGRCQLCNQTESIKKGRLCLDHDHETGAFRAWLCFDCNWLMGSYEKALKKGITWENLDWLIRGQFKTRPADTYTRVSLALEFQASRLYSMPHGMDFTTGVIPALVT